MMNTKIMNVLKFVVLAISILLSPLLFSVQILANENDMPDVIRDENINDKKTPEKLFLELRHSIDDSAGITYKPKGNIRHTVYMFSSTECSHCIHAAREIKPLLDKYHAELKILFCGLNELPRQNAIQAVCKNLDLDSYNQKPWKREQSKPDSECAKAAMTVDKSIELSRIMEIHNLPTFFMESGQKIVGAKMEELEKALKN
jgi:hypothetical protein